MDNTKKHIILINLWDCFEITFYFSALHACNAFVLIWFMHSDYEFNPIVASSNTVLPTAVFPNLFCPKPYCLSRFYWIWICHLQIPTIPPSSSSVPCGMDCHSYVQLVSVFMDFKVVFICSCVFLCLIFPLLICFLWSQIISLAAFD